jgi:hypothetical protein
VIRGALGLPRGPGPAAPEIRQNPVEIRIGVTVLRRTGRIGALLPGWRDGFRK